MDGDSVVAVEDPEHPGYRFQVVFAEDGRVIGWGIFSERLLPSPKELPADDPSWGPPSVVTARVIRSAHFGAIERAARQLAAEDAGLVASGELPTDLSPTERRQLGRLRKAIGETRRPGPKGGNFVLDDRHYALVAHDYVRALAKSSKPNAVVGAQWIVAPKTVRNWIFEARERKLLSETPPGKAGGHLTEKGKRALKGHIGKGK